MTQGRAWGSFPGAASGRGRLLDSVLYSVQIWSIALTTISGCEASLVTVRIFVVYVL